MVRYPPCDIVSAKTMLISWKRMDVVSANTIVAGFAVTKQLILTALAA
jgi:hypothetical protein